MSYVIDKEPWLKSEVSQIRSLTYAIDATTALERVPQNLKDIEAIARRARRRLTDLGVKNKQRVVVSELSGKGNIIYKAIEILEIETGSRHEPADPDLYDAQRLGIEALKRIMEIRSSPLGYTEFSLPGETEK